MVLREVTSTLLHLAPSPVVARVWTAGRRDPLVVARELEVTSYLAQSGAAVAAPYDDAGPFEVDDEVVTPWHLVDHDARGRSTAGRPATVVTPATSTTRFCRLSAVATADKRRNRRSTGDSHARRNRPTA